MQPKLIFGPLIIHKIFLFSEWRRGLYELILNGIQGTIKKEAVVSTLNELAVLNGALPSTTVDLFTLLDAEIQGETRNNYKYIVKECEKVHFENTYSYFNIIYVYLYNVLSLYFI